LSERLPFLELSSIQISEMKYQVNRGNPHWQAFSNIFANWSKMPSKIIISKCVSTQGVCGCRPTLPSALAYTRTLTLSLFLSLCVFVLFPFDIKTHLPQIMIIIEIQDSVVFSCSHFIGSTNTKISPLFWTKFDEYHHQHISS
jgi:hypothetical protein